MLKRGNKILSLFVVFVMLMFTSIASVDAAVVGLGQKYYYYTTKDSNYGFYYGTSSATGATRGTVYKTLDGVEAFCVQADTYSPKNGVEYVEVSWGEAVGGRTWNSTEAFVAGILMEIVDLHYTGNDAYVYKYSVLNSYLGFNKSENFSVYNTQISDYTIDAINSYYAYAPTSSLPSFGATAAKTVMDEYKAGSNTYYVGSFTLSNLVDTYGTVPVTYSINVPDNVKLYTDAALTKEAPLTYNGNLSGTKVFYVKYTGSDVGGQVQINVAGYNSGTYSVARLWRTADTSLNYQMLVTYDTHSQSRYRSRTVTFEVPDVTQKTIKIVKKDAGTGKNLVGSTLKLQLSGGSTSACTVQSGNYSCSIPVIAEELTGDTYYSVIETTAPDGYVIGSVIENVKWDINSSGNVCYASSDSGLIATDIEDCNRSYQVNTVCTTDDGVTKEGACEVVVDPSLPEDTPEEDITYITVGTEEKVCHYLDGENVVKVDESKCNTQYVKATNSSGNLVVEYYNTKNHVEISKYAINGEKELVGAELKICSTKPDANGNCTIVRNTLEGQCMGNTTAEGQLNLTTEYNCVNNDDNTKTVDMHWISGLSSKIWYGIPKGTYYLVETVAPSGYLPLSTYVEFTVDANGNITSTEYDEETKKIIVRNQPTSFKVFKQDAKDGKNLAGATLSICSAFKDTDGVYRLDVGSDGYCFPAVLSNGTAATWITTDKAKTISGLGIGTYYLVELTAPENYSIADSILFTVNADGTITDKDGNLINNNELIMTDIEIVNEKTGDLPILMITLIGVGAIVICGLSYYYLVKKNGFEIIKNKFKKNK